MSDLVRDLKIANMHLRAKVISLASILNFMASTIAESNGNVAGEMYQASQEALELAEQTYMAEVDGQH